MFERAEGRRKMAPNPIGVPFHGFRRCVRAGVVFEPTLEILSHGHLGRLNMEALIHFVQNPDQLALCVALCPAISDDLLPAPAVVIAGQVIADRPRSRAALFDVAFHGFLLFAAVGGGGPFIFATNESDATPVRTQQPTTICRVDECDPS